MNCVECRKLLAEYLVGELDRDGILAITGHLASCDLCAMECARLAEALDVFDLSCEASDAEPPNPSALWCRISNTIEQEILKQSESEKDSQNSSGQRRWTLSMRQLLLSVAAIALISSLLTVVGIKNYFDPGGTDFVSRSADNQTTFEKLLSRVGLTETPQAARERRLREQQAAIEYWSQRVAAKRAFWDENLRRGFDRNLQAIDQAVIEYQRSLEQNPDDELSGEMLDSVMNEKMNLLREFAEL